MIAFDLNEIVRCHKLYESIILKTIPIVRTTLDPMAKNDLKIRII